MRLAKYRIVEGALIPRGYGIAYYDIARAEVICYPIPLNIFINYARKIYWKLVKPSLPKIESVIAKAYSKGKFDGWNLHKQQMEKEFERWLKERG